MGSAVRGARGKVRRQVTGSGGQELEICSEADVIVRPALEESDFGRCQGGRAGDSANTLQIKASGQDNA